MIQCHEFSFFNKTFIGRVGGLRLADSADSKSSKLGKSEHIYPSKISKSEHHRGLFTEIIIILLAALAILSVMPTNYFLHENILRWGMRWEDS